MLLEENQISFRSDDEIVVDGVKDYSHQIAEMIGLGSDAEFREAGVSFYLSTKNCSISHYFFLICIKFSFFLRLELVVVHLLVQEVI